MSLFRKNTDSVKASESLSIKSRKTAAEFWFPPLEETLMKSAPIGMANPFPAMLCPSILPINILYSTLW